MTLQFDIRYPIGSLLGLARLAQFILGILVLICIGVAKVQETGVSFIYFVATASLITSLIFLILHVLHLPETGPFARIPWNMVEFGFLALWAVLYFISGIMTAVWSASYANFTTNTHSSYGAASFFCFAAALVYGICAYVYFGRWRTHTITTGGSVTVTERHTTTTSSSRY